VHSTYFDPYTIIIREKQLHIGVTVRLYIVILSIIRFFVIKYVTIFKNLVS